MPSRTVQQSPLESTDISFTYIFGMLRKPGDETAVYSMEIKASSKVNLNQVTGRVEPLFTSI